MRRAIAVGVVGSLGLSFLAVPAFAGPRDVLVELSGAGATKELAQSYVDMFLRYAETNLSWSANGSKGTFEDNGASAIAALKSLKPGFAMLDPDVYLALRKEYALQMIATVSGPPMDRGHLSVVVKGDTVKTLDDLKGKTLSATNATSPRYLSKIVFGGKLDAATHFTLKKASTATAPKKALDRGEADAALLDDAQVKNLLPGMRVIFTSAPLPPTPFVAVGKNAKKEDIAAVGKMVQSMCGDPKGAEVCKALQITSFGPVDAKANDDAIKQFDK